MRSKDDRSIASLPVDRPRSFQQEEPPGDRKIDPRASRNLAEKLRRSTLACYTKEIGDLLPSIQQDSNNPKRFDKVTIMRLGATLIRLSQAIQNDVMGSVPLELRELDLEQFVENLLDSDQFLIVMTAAGKVLYVSPKVKDNLGHTQISLFGHSLYKFVHEGDCRELAKNITPDHLQGIVSTSSLFPTNPQIADTASDCSNSSDEASSFQEQRRTFELRMMKHVASTKQDHVQYERIRFTGLLKLADTCKISEVNASGTRHRGANKSSHDYIFVAVARVLARQPKTAILRMDANKNEYFTRHLVDGRIVYCDHRVSVVTGYLAEEVYGESAFAFMHTDDYKWPITLLCRMYDSSETLGSSCYRLRSKTGAFIYLHTVGQLEYDDEGTVVSYVCINTLMSEKEGSELMQQMKTKFSATKMGMIQSRVELFSSESASSSQQSIWTNHIGDPKKVQLEYDVGQLVSHLSKVESEELSSESLGKSEVQYLTIQSNGDVTPKEESNTNIVQQVHSEEQEKSKSMDPDIPEDILNADVVEKCFNTLCDDISYDIKVEQPLYNAITPDSKANDQCSLKRTHEDTVTRFDDPKQFFELNLAFESAIHNGIVWLGGRLASQELGDVEQDMEKYPVLQAKRKKVTLLQTEINEQKIILDRLQQDHRNIQIIKHNIDV